MKQQNNRQRGRETKEVNPGTYLLSFACHRREAEKISVPPDTSHNPPAVSSAPRAFPSEAARPPETESIRDAMDRMTHSATLRAVRELCEKKDWNLLAGNVRANRIHLVVQAQAPPEWVINTLKLYSGPTLNELSLDLPDDRSRLAGQESARYLWTRDQLSAAILGVISGDIEPLALVETL